MLLHTPQALLTSILSMLQPHVEANAFDGRGPEASAAVALIVGKAEVMQRREEAMAALPDVGAIDFALDATCSELPWMRDDRAQDLHNFRAALAPGEVHSFCRIVKAIAIAIAFRRLTANFKVDHCFLLFCFFNFVN